MRRALVVSIVTLAAGCASLRDLGPAASRLAGARSATSPAADVRAAREHDERGDDLAGRTADAPRYSVLGCIRSPEVDAWERRLAREERQWRRMIESSRGRGAAYAQVRAIVEAEGLPPGLALLPAIESGYRRDATGPTGARGLWQFGAKTARNYGLVVSRTRDDRTNVALSTHAALRHLRDLRERYGTWPLALAAYNAGEGRVRRAMRPDVGDTFWRLAKAERLPLVTRRYVPKFLALVRVLHDVDQCPALGPAVLATAE